MATRKRKDIETNLSQKGFTLQDGKDHRNYFFMLNDRLVARTKVSLGTKYKDLGNDLITAMARQCHLTKDQFLELVDCTMSQQDYEVCLREKQLLASNTGIHRH